MMSPPPSLSFKRVAAAWNADTQKLEISRLGAGGTATAGDGGTISIKWWDNAAGRWRVVIGYVGEDGLEAGKKYRLSDDRKFVEVK
jgi:hypothetical protein